MSITIGALRKAFSKNIRLLELGVEVHFVWAHSHNHELPDEIDMPTLQRMLMTNQAAVLVDDGLGGIPQPIPAYLM